MNAWPVYQDFFNHTPSRLTFRKPIWSDLVPVDTASQWRDEWQSVSVVNKNLISDSTIRLPGFDLCRSTWSILNRFHTSQGRCAANLYKWHMASTDKCHCGAVQTMNHIVEFCPLTRLTDDGDLSRLHSADYCAVMWPQNVAVKAFAKWKFSLSAEYKYITHKTQFPFYGTTAMTSLTLTNK